ncbi:hypothetical protein [Bradyrhizobium australiense]|uniref:hypothetical protein n=1 Tax=Bradyrhizobium australiense TaxID=2721161 RepID=UPI001AEE8C84|nr:hypothetical protein [Bradyrhizobium australiense]
MTTITILSNSPIGCRMCPGGPVISSIEQRTSWEIDYNLKARPDRREGRLRLRLDQIRFTAGYGADKQHESVSFSHALLAATEKLKIIAAIPPAHGTQGWPYSFGRFNVGRHPGPKKQERSVRP